MSYPLSEAQKPPVLDADAIAYLGPIAQATFRGFQKTMDPATGFPVDIAPVLTGDVMILPENEYYSKTSPTNIGFAFLYLILARDRGWLSQERVLALAGQMLATLEKLERYENFFYNWYYVSGKAGQIPSLSFNRFISSVDNGNLDAFLMVFCGAFPETNEAARAQAILDSHDYHFFLGKNTVYPDNGLINIGYDTEKKSFLPHDYSILNTEARLTAFMSIFKDGLPDSVWKKQSRLVRYYRTLKGETIPVVAPWGGSLFEALLADEIMAGDRIAPAAFAKNALHLIRIHQDKGRRISDNGIWGMANGEVPAMDYYEMAGVPEIAYCRFPGEFVTLYASFLALRYDPLAVIENFKKVRQLNRRAYHPYFGFTDSVDPKTRVSNFNILSLDKGMEMLAIGNFLNQLEGKKETADYFWSYAAARGWADSARALLRAEEDHPCFRQLQEGTVCYSTRPTNPAPVDLFDVIKTYGKFTEPDRSKAEYRLLEEGTDSKNGSRVLELEYNVTERYTYAGLYFRCADVDVSAFRAFSFEARGSRGKGYPSAVKVELKWQGQTVQFEQVSLGDNWNETRVYLPQDSEKIDEVAFVVENAAALDNLEGALRLRALKFI